MTWEQLLDQRRVRPHRTSKQELDALRALIALDLQDAALPGLSADRRFAIAHNAALQTAKIAIACAGYRVTAFTSRLLGLPLAISALRIVCWSFAAIRHAPH